MEAVSMIGKEGRAGKKKTHCKETRNEGETHGTCGIINTGKSSIINAIDKQEPLKPIGSNEEYCIHNELCFNWQYFP